MKWEGVPIGRVAGLFALLSLLGGCGGGSQTAQTTIGPTPSITGPTPSIAGPPVTPFPESGFRECPATPELFALGHLCVKLRGANRDRGEAYRVNVEFSTSVELTYVVDGQASFWPPGPGGEETLLLCDYGPTVAVDVFVIGTDGQERLVDSAAASYECAGPMN